MKAFKGSDNLFYLVTTNGTRVHGPFNTVAEVKAVASMIPAHERSNEAARQLLTPQPADKAEAVFVR
jgi:hypothetical protein